jgi:hypothetical protein
MVNRCCKTFLLKYAIRKANNERLEFSRAHNFLVCVADVPLQGKNIHTIKTNTDTISQDAGPKVNVEKMKFSNTSPNAHFPSVVLTVCS